MPLFIYKQGKTPLKQARGLDSSYATVCQLILVKAPVEATAQALSSIKQMNVWEQSVYGRKIKVFYESTFVICFHGHSWSLIYMPLVVSSRIDENRRVGDLSKYKSLVRPPYFSESQYPEESTQVIKPKRQPTPLLDQDALELSRLMHTCAIYYTESDSEQITGYQLYSDGVLQEKFLYEAGSPIQFQSKLRQIDSRKIEGRLYAFVDKFLRQQDAYIPDIDAMADYVIHEDLTVEIRDFTAEDVERLDYLAFQ